MNPGCHWGFGPSDKMDMTIGRDGESLTFNMPRKDAHSSSTWGVKRLVDRRLDLVGQVRADMYKLGGGCKVKDGLCPTRGAPLTSESV